MTAKARTFEVIGTKRMPPEHEEAGCEVQVGFNYEGPDGFGFASFSLTREQAFRLKERLDYALETLFPQDES